MPADEYADWQAYFQIEPPGTHGIEVLIAQLCQLVIASSGTKSPEITDLMPFVKLRKSLLNTKVLTNEQLYEKFMAKAPKP